jgi:hypothetical protein
MKRRTNVISPIDTVNTLPEMLIATDSSVEDGEIVYVRSTQAFYVYRIGSGLVPDGVNVIASIYGSPAGVWVLLNISTTVLSTPAETRYVDKNGSDTDGDGSFVKPFLTIQKAYTSITDASSVKPYRIAIGVGTFSEVFVMTPWVFLVGSGRSVTTIAPVQGNWLGAGFATATQQDAGISDCTLTTTLTIDFTGNTAASRFKLCECYFDGAGSSFTAGGVTTRLEIQNVEQISIAAGITHTFTNWAVTDIEGYFKNNTLAIIHNAAYLGTVIFGNVSCGACSVTCASLIQLQVCTLFCRQPLSATPTLIGDGAFCTATTSAGMRQIIVPPDANVTFLWSNNVAPVAGAVHLISGADLILNCAPSANRTWTFGNSPANGTKMVIANQTGNGSLITLVSTGLVFPSYVPAGGAMRLRFGSGWELENNPYLQTATVPLVAGLSAFVPADITGGGTPTKWSFGLITPGGTLGIPSVQVGGTVSGRRDAGGGFFLESLTTAGVRQVLDTSTYGAFLTIGS